MATKAPMSPEEHRAKSKLRALSEGIRVWKLEDSETPRYACPSATNPGIAHEIIVHGRDFYDVSCNCPSGYNRGSCKHIGAVLLLMEAEEQLEASHLPDRLEQELADIG